VFATPWRRLGVSLLTLCLAIGALPLSAISATAVSTDIVISEYRTRGPNGGNDEFIELQNISSSPVSIAGWKIKGSNNTGGGTTPPRATIPAGVMLAAGCNYLLTNSAVSAGPYSGAIAGDQTYGTGVGDDGGIAVTTAADVIVDQVGMHTGSAFKEGTVLAPFGSANTDRSYQRKAGSTGGLQDTDNNANDFAMVAPSTPRNRASCGESGPSVSATTPANSSTGAARDANIIVAFSEPVNVSGSWYSISCATSGAYAAAASGGPTTFTLDPTTDFGANESCSVTITAAQVSDQDALDPPDTMAADHSFTFTTIDQTNCGEPATYIHQIQGAALQSGMVGQRRTVEGVVVGDYQETTQFRGYHLQEEDGDADTDSTTSEGIFVFSTTPVSTGDVVRVTGTVSEFPAASPNTQLENVTILVCPAGGTVTPTDVDLPVASISDLERFESMLVSFDQRLTVTETFGLGRFGEVVLSASGRLDTPTAVVEPGTDAQALQAQNDRSRIVLDDGINTQNIDPTRYPQGGLSASNTLRVGDSIADLVGVLEQRFSLYRLQPVGTLSFVHDNARPTDAPVVGGSAQVAAMNVLNYFTTLAGAPVCGPSGELDCRGAETTFEFERQRAKILAALVGLDADIVGLMEIENNERAAVEDLVAGLNDALGAGTYSYIDTGTIGTDAIKVALIYKPAAATPVGAYAILDSTVDPRFIDTRNRPALAQTFDLASGGRFTVVVNHLKSKGSACAGDPDTGDGSGNCNLTRTLAAQAMVDWLASDPTASGDRDVLVIGDLNAYAKEDPIDVFRNAGYTDLIDRFQDDAYSYVFMGQSGYLDHALASPTLAAQVTGANEWHVNADEPTVLDYNTNFKSAGHVNTLYAPDAYRSSDHDPLLVGLDLIESETLAPVGNSGTAYTQAGSTVVLSYSGTMTLGDAVLEGPTSQRIDCATGAPMGSARTETLAENGNDAFRWKTDKSWSDTCRQLQLVMESGTVIAVRFDFR
jgi:predicted extracellular nuclease